VLRCVAVYGNTPTTSLIGAFQQARGNLLHCDSGEEVASDSTSAYVCCGVLQFLAVCCSFLLCVAISCCVLKCALDLLMARFGKRTEFTPLLFG